MTSPRRTANLCLKTGIILATVGIAWTVFGLDLYYAITGAPIDTWGMYALNQVGRVLQFFGMPLAAALIGVAIVLRHLPEPDGRVVFPELTDR